MTKSLIPKPRAGSAHPYMPNNNAYNDDAWTSLGSTNQGVTMSASMHQRAGQRSAFSSLQGVRPAKNLIRHQWHNSAHSTKQESRIYGNTTTVLSQSNTNHGALSMINQDMYSDNQTHYLTQQQNNMAYKIRSASYNSHSAIGPRSKRQQSARMIMENASNASLAQDRLLRRKRELAAMNYSSIQVTN